MLEQILALKLLGFSLEEIGHCLRHGPSSLDGVLVRQKEMLLDRRRQLDRVVEAIERAERAVERGTDGWEAIAGVIRATQMEQKPDWIEKYFTPEQFQTMGQLAQEAYGADIDWQARGVNWTEADQEKASAEWRHVAEEANRLAAAGAEPGGEEAQELAGFKTSLLSAFTQGDPKVEAGLQQLWEGFIALPKAEQPFDASPFMPSEVGAKLLDEAMAIYSERQAGQ